MHVFLGVLMKYPIVASLHQRGKAFGSIGANNQTIIMDPNILTESMLNNLMPIGLSDSAVSVPLVRYDGGILLDVLPNVLRQGLLIHPFDRFCSDVAFSLHQNSNRLFFGATPIVALVFGLLALVLVLGLSSHDFGDGQWFVAGEGTALALVGTLGATMITIFFYILEIMTK